VLRRLPDLVDAPDFDLAMVAMAKAMLRVGEADPSLAAIFKDAGRYVVALCAAALQDEGVTLNRLRILCAGFGIVSSGRVYALLQYMRYLGFVDLWSERDLGGRVRYAVAQTFLTRWRLHLEAALTAAGKLDPVALEAAQNLSDPVFMARFCAVQMETLGAFSQQTDTSSALFQVFLNRHAGSQILWSLLANADAANLVTAAFAIAPSDLASQFGVSRMHVSRLLRDARDAGILVPDGSDKIRFSTSAVDDIHVFYAWQLGLLIVAATRALPCRQRDR
jgi:CRP-like cAMP-binding protein